MNYSLDSKTTFSIIIPARNEEENIDKCLSSIFNNNYPADLYEVIVIDDDSNDNTAAVVQQFQSQHKQLRLLHINDLLNGEKINSYKKKAIESAIHVANSNYIVTTDADCIVSENWLSNFDNYIQQTGKKFIAAPVSFIDNDTFLGRFQCLDFLSLQGITAASVSAGFHSMCNGANLCYEKDVFFKVNGFSGIDQLASGDDMLLMHKIQQQFPDAIGYIYLKSAIVQTLPMLTWKTFINQRIRWASKATNYNDIRITLVLWLVYILNVLLLATLVLAFFHPFDFIYWFALLFLKTIVELLFMQKVATFYEQESLLKWFAVMQPLHILYTVVAGLLGKFGKYQWKGRKVK
ncbi:glycosyltransferase [Arachidicoccus ginsenosidimutans]|uniref:glycosyltransferase n=1 Tax=Arachidicoccus sp. BS20 TaxID=1850526 RepID=UPI0018D34E27|nr:glycosyltransferase [Arachidicoccus sp. BS20]